MNTLIANFSYTGHTKGIAGQLQELTGGTLFEIKPAVPYFDDYDTAERQGRKETSDGYRPALAEMPDGLDTYDTVLLGTPNWFNTVAPPVASFLTDGDMSGKRFVNRWSECRPTHHFAAATGRYIDAILKVSKIFNVPVEVITR